MRIYISECLGIDPNHITTVEKVKNGYLIQFRKETRGIWTIDHDDDEYCFFHKDYGFTEVYDFVRKGGHNKRD